MEDNETGEEPPQEKPFYVDRAKSGRAGCKKCKQKINAGDLRLGKLGYNPFSSGTMKYWHHVPCMFEVFKKQRKTTKRIDSFFEIGGWDELSDADKQTIKGYFDAEELEKLEANSAAEVKPADVSNNVEVKDNSFRAFRKICSELTNASSYLTKTSIVKDFFEKGSEGSGFKGDIQLWCRSLLPMAAKRIYNLQSKQLVKIFSDIFRTDQDSMLEDLEQGDVAETIGKFFDSSSAVSPAKKAVLTLQEVDTFLEYLSKLTREADQIDHFKSILPKCTTNDLKIIIRLIKHDLRINAGPKHILEALDPNAYPAFQASRDLATVVRNAIQGKGSGTKGKGDVKPAKGMQVAVSILTPVLPMLAEACSSIEMAFKKCPDGMYAEIKYDGERVQLHKQGDNFKYFSRSLKPVLHHKVSHFEKYIPLAFPHGKDMILDSEILMVDTKTGQPLPFGTLGVHKKAAFQDACVCLFVFDCIYYNGQSLIEKPISERRKVLHDNMKEITHHVVFSEMEEIHVREDLEAMMERVFRQGLEGLVLKPLNSKYEPGKRHWLKVKKDYLAGGKMADTADLVVLGAWFGTGKKGGIMSVFLMGCYDERRRHWVTVTKVHGGHDDRTLESLQKELSVEKIGRDASRVPAWLHCGKTMVPDFVVKDPKESQVWEVTGAEFTCNQVHTADGISIRFPRVTRIRKDKNWETATSLAELKKLYEASKDTSGFTLHREPQNSALVSPDMKSKKETKTQERPDKEKAETEESLPEGEKSSKRKEHDDSSDRERHKKRKEEPKDRSNERDDRGEHKRKRNPDESPARKDSEKRRDEASVKESRKDHKHHRERNGSPGEKNHKKHKRERSQSSPKRESREERSKRKENEGRGSPGGSGSKKSRKEESTPQKEHRKESSTDSQKKHKKESSVSSRNHTPEKSHRDRSRDRVATDSEDRHRKDDRRKNDSRNNEKTSTEKPKKPRIVFDSSSEEEKPGNGSGSETEVDEDPIPNASVRIAMKNTLPEVFAGCVIFLHEKVSDSALLTRFVIAYGGILYSESRNTCLENSKLPITHVVYPFDKVSEKLELKMAERAKHVAVDWLWESIKRQTKIDESEFTVTVR